MAVKKLSGAEFRAEMKRPKPGAYLLYGDEGFLKRRALDDLRAKLCADESLSAFNHFVFTDESYSPDALISAVLAPAMMSDIKLVELYCLPFADYRKREDQDAITSSLESASKSDDTLLIIYTTPENFDPGEGKTPSAWMKLLTKYAIPVEFEREPTPKLVTWVQKHFTSVGLIAEASECSYLVETVGHDMLTLENEIEKLCCHLKANGRDRLSRADIELNCPRNKEIGAFDFADAILDANNEKAFYILADMRSKNEPAQLILGSIMKIYLDLVALKIYSDAGVSPDDAAKKLGMHPYVAKLRMARARSCDRRMLEEVIELCAVTDSSIKTSAADEYVLLERLISRVSQTRMAQNSRTRKY